MREIERDKKCIEKRNTRLWEEKPMSSSLGSGITEMNYYKLETIELYRIPTVNGIIKSQCAVSESIRLLHNHVGRI